MNSTAQQLASAIGHYPKRIIAISPKRSLFCLLRHRHRRTISTAPNTSRLINNTSLAMAPKRKRSVTDVPAETVAAAPVRRRTVRQSSRKPNGEYAGPTKSVAKETGKIEKSVKLKSIEAKYPQEPNNDGAQDDEASAVERGARRPRPIHSNLLPLPWSGRLGYVSLPHLISRLQDAG